MSTPEVQSAAHGLDPLSEAIGEIRGRLTAVEKALEKLDMTKATTSELRVWGTLILLAIGGLFSAVLGLTLRLPGR